MLKLLSRVKDGSLSPERGLLICQRNVRKAAKSGSLSRISSALKKQYEWTRYFNL